VHSASTADELRSLRARAYGPDGDDRLDAASLARLRELESAGRASAEPARGPAPPPAAAPVATEPADDGTEALEPENEREDDESGEQEGAAGSPRGRMALLWAATVLIPVVVAVSVTAGVVEQAHRAPLGAGGPQVARLAVDPALELAESLLPVSSDGRRFENHHGLMVAVGTYGDGRSEGCLWVTDTLPEARENGSFEGGFWTDCAAGGFPAAVKVPVTERSPEALQQAYGPGSTLLLSYDPDTDEVMVHASSPRR